MADPLFQFLDAANIDDNREYIIFRFTDCAGEQEIFQVDFGYIESLAVIFQQALLSATLEDRYGRNRSLGRERVAVPPRRRGYGQPIIE